jgi:hypothetical protein
LYRTGLKGIHRLLIIFGERYIGHVPEMAGQFIPFDPFGHHDQDLVLSGRAASLVAPERSRGIIKLAGNHVSNQGAQNSFVWHKGIRGNGLGMSDLLKLIAQMFNKEDGYCPADPVPLFLSSHFRFLPSQSRLIYRPTERLLSQSDYIDR